MLPAPGPVPVRAPAHAWGQQLRSQSGTPLGTQLAVCPLLPIWGLLTGGAVGGFPEVEMLRWRRSHFGMGFAK